MGQIHVVVGYMCEFIVLMCKIEYVIGVYKTKSLNIDLNSDSETHIYMKRD